MELKILSGADEDIRREFTRWFENEKGELFYYILDEKLELLRNFPLLGQVYRVPIDGF